MAPSLALLLSDRLIVRPRLATATGLALCMAMMAYTSGYLMVFATVMIAIVLVARVADWRHNAARVAGAFALATVVTAIAVIPLAIPYRRVATEQNMVRPLAEVA